MSLTPANKNFKIWKGATFHYRFTWLTGGLGSQPQNVTGYGGTLTIKDSAGTTLLTLTETSFGQGIGGLVFGTSDGLVDIIISDTVTADLTWTKANYELLARAPSGGEVTALLRGSFSVNSL